MGQKIHPTGFRLAVTRAWGSRWFANNRNFAGMLAEDLQVREYLKSKLKNAAVSKITIERPAKNARITIFSARPGVVIGKKGEDIENLKAELGRRLGVPVAVNIEEVRKPEVDAQLIADSITQQLEKRIMFRRAMKRAMQNAMRLGAQGIKIMSSGRLNGIEIARCEWYREGRVPLHTLRADIDYGFSEAKTTYGVIGVKVWVYRGDRLANGDAPQLPKTENDGDRHAQAAAEFGLQVLDVLALLADHHARTRREDGDAGVLGRALDQDARDRCALQARLQELANLQVLGQHAGEVLVRRVPARGPVARDRQTEADRMNFLSHGLPCGLSCRR
jgi:small subunit ribosomal protein S3